jgi:hypothetical protein
MRRPKEHHDYNRPLTGERALAFPRDHAERHRPIRPYDPVRTHGFVRIVR